MSEDVVPTSLEKSIAIIPKVGGALSLIASTAIIRDVSIKWRNKNSVSLSSLLVFCISVADFFFSFFGSFMSTWMVPADSWHYLAAGNTQSCSAQGFITILSLTSSNGHYALLMLLFWLTVRNEWTESQLKDTRFRLYFVIPPIILAFSIATPPLFKEMYNPSLMQCAIVPYPLECEHDPDTECMRGEGAWDYWDALFWCYVIFTLVIILSVVLLFCSVFKQERKLDKYLIEGQERRRESTKKTLWQGIRYIGAFVLAYFPAYIYVFYRFCTPHLPPPYVFYLDLIFPSLWGVFNAFAYFRPRYLTYKENNPSASRITCLGNVLNIKLHYLDRRTEQGHNSVDADNSPEGDMASPLFQHNEDFRDEASGV